MSTRWRHCPSQQLLQYRTALECQATPRGAAEPRPLLFLSAAWSVPSRRCRNFRPVGSDSRQHNLGSQCLRAEGKWHQVPLLVAPADILCAAVDLIPDVLCIAMSCILHAVYNVVQLCVHVRGVQCARMQLCYSVLPGAGGGRCQQDVFINYRLKFSSLSFPGCRRLWRKEA